MTDRTIGLVTTGKIIKIDGAYYREFTYRKNKKDITVQSPIENMFADFVGEEVKIRIDVRGINNQWQK